MPLVRFEVRNEYGLGQPELYRDADREDPKAVLDGVAVAGLVGILRQLGDLAEFAAEVFHALQEQVMTTTSRHHKLKVRLQNIEAALPSLEKAVLSQTSHLHFAYTPGSEWHPRIQNGKNHFIYNDFPRFIMDSYEECHDPPPLHSLDKFDTGGPGSCLRRYSDPTYFRRESGISKESDGERVQKDRKARKSKKKRSSQRTRDSLHSTSMSNYGSSRMRVTTSFNGQASPSHTASTIEMTLKSDLGECTNSLDSRNGSGSIECIFHLGSSVQPEEQESLELSSRFMNPSIPDSAFSDGPLGVADDNFPHHLSPELIAANLSRVTWDEKAEIVQLKNQSCDEDEAKDMDGSDSFLRTQEGRKANLGNHDQMINLFADENAQKSSPDRIQIDEVDSEADNFVDALNTIESESDNDLDCQTKHEVEHFSFNVNGRGTEDGLDKTQAHIYEHQSSKYESHTVSDEAYSNGEMSSDLSNSVISECFTHDQTSHVSKKFPDSNYLPEKFANSNYLPKYESHTAYDISSNKEMSCDLPSLDQSNSSSHEQTNHVLGRSCTKSCSPGIEVSTHGDAPDSEGSRNNDDALAGSKVTSYDSDHSPGFEGLVIVDAYDSSNMESIVTDPTSSGSRNSNQPVLLTDKATNISVKSQESQAEFSGISSVTFWTNGGLLGLEPSKPPDFSVRYSANQESVTRTKADSVVVPSNQPLMPGNHFQGGKPCGLDNGRNMPVNVDNNVTSFNASQENERNSPNMFGLGHRLLINGFGKSMSFPPSGKPELASPRKSSVLELWRGDRGIRHAAAPEEAFNEFGRKSSLDSLKSSPPLEHMKISFHPINGFEASKLKLKFPDGSHSNESIRYMFPSFQLVPESAIPLHDVGFDSDGDTFCRSSRYMSDDCLSHHSETDSEQWESSECPQSTDRELYDALHRISSVESLSCSLQTGETGNDGIHIESGLKNVYTENGADPSLSASFLDLPSFDAVNPMPGEAKDTLGRSEPLESQYPSVSTPLPPPLPPVQWQISRFQSDVAIDKQHAVSEVHEHAFNLNLLQSTVPRQPKTGQANDQKINDEAVTFISKTKQQDLQKFGSQKEVSQPAHGKGMDENEDLLQQIRSKSFTLRCTVAAKPTITSGPTANDKVTAILKKANAIRQAVGSDDGEDDDTWSDT